MTTPAPAPAPAAPPAAPSSPGGPIAKAEAGLGRLLHRAEADAAPAITRLASAARDHAGLVFSVAADAGDVIKLIDPADSAAVAAGEAFLEKIWAMAESGAQIASVALAASKPAA